MLLRRAVRLKEEVVANANEPRDMTYSRAKNEGRFACTGREVEESSKVLRRMGNG